MDSVGEEGRVSRKTDTSQTEWAFRRYAGGYSPVSRAISADVPQCLILFALPLILRAYQLSPRKAYPPAKILTYPQKCVFLRDFLHRL